MSYLLQGEAGNDPSPLARVEEQVQSYAVANTVEHLADNLRHMWLALPDDERRRLYDQVALAYGISQINKRPRSS